MVMLLNTLTLILSITLTFILTLPSHPGGRKDCRRVYPPDGCSRAGLTLI